MSLKFRDYVVMCYEIDDGVLVAVVDPVQANLFNLIFKTRFLCALFINRCEALGVGGIYSRTT